MNDVKGLIKIASQVQQALLKMHSFRYQEILRQLSNFTKKFQDAISEAKKLEISLSRGWLSAADCCCSSISIQIADMMYFLSQTKQLVEKPPEKIPSLSSLFEELKQLQRDFDKVDFDLKENTISIVTGPITLDDVYLGPFKIQLELKYLAELYKGSPYYCIALDPHPATANEDVTHPHIREDSLCEGEGAVAIKAALEQGRLCDFFTLVNSILTHYSPDSPYISLDDWDGEPCYECGYIMDRENNYYCSFCDHGFCEECTTCCNNCDEIVCLGCSLPCPYCEERICPNCITKCAGCGAECCKSCLEDNMCPNCIEELEKEYEEQRKQTNRNNRNSNPDQTKTNNPKIKLAS